jgi:hypothetical protein
MPWRISTTCLLIPKQSHKTEIHYLPQIRACHITLEANEIGKTSSQPTALGHYSLVWPYDGDFRADPTDANQKHRTHRMCKEIATVPHPGRNEN